MNVETVTHYVLVAGTAQLEVLVDRADVHSISQEIAYQPGECLDYRDDDPGLCSGPVEDRWAGGMNGRSWPRCERHGDLRQASYDRSMERYADSDVEPSWFDPSFAGERWSDD